MKSRSFVVVALVLAGCGAVPRVWDKVLDAEAAKLDPAASAQLSTARQLPRSGREHPTAANRAGNAAPRM